MKFVAVVFLLALSSSAFAAPGNFVLRPYTKVQVNEKEGWADVYYTAPCSYSDWASVVSANDDTGDQVNVVGVAVPMDSRSCTPSKTYKEFSVRVPKEFDAYKAFLYGSFERMTVKRTNR